MYFLLTPEYDTWSCFKDSFPECGELGHLGLLLGRVSVFPTTLVFLHPAADVEKAKRAEGNYHCSKTQSSSATHHICPDAIGEGESRGHMCEQNDKHRLWVGCGWALGGQSWSCAHSTPRKEECSFLMESSATVCLQSHDHAFTLGSLLGACGRR